MTILIGLIIFLLSYLIGSLPLGGWLIQMVTGKRASTYSAHDLGVENLLYFIGAPLAISSFFLDIAKAVLAVALFQASPWAALGVFVGHLYPLSILQKEDVPRGRGNGVLLGILAGLWATGALPWLLASVPVFIYALTLGLTSYVALAGLAGLASLPLLSFILGFPAAFTFATGAILFLAVWRYRFAVARILDGTEPQLGEPPPVLGRDPSVVLTAFMIHPIDLDDLWQARSQRWLERLHRRGVLPEWLIRRALFHMQPQKYDEIKGIRLSDGRELRVMLIGGAMLPDQIRNYPAEAKRMAISGAQLAQRLGAEAFGLGAFWSTVGDKGLEVQAAVPGIAITNGGAYTAASVKAAVPGLLRQFEREGGSLKQASAAVVGANGVVAFGVARMIAAEVGELVLIGRDSVRLERSAETLRRKFPETVIQTSLNVAVCGGADLIFTATSDPNPVILPAHVKPGAWIFDLGRPADVDPAVTQVPGVHIIPGGVVRPPGEMHSHIDIHFGDGMVPACMAETMIMTATGAFTRRSLGPHTKTADIDFYLREGERLGFEIVTRDARVAPLSEVL